VPRFTFVPKDSSFGQGERDCENVIGNNIEYISKLLDGYLPTEKAIKYERYEALPANRREFMDMFVDPITGDLLQDYSLRRMRGVISFYDIRDKTCTRLRKNISRKFHLFIQYTEYIKARVRERSLEDKAAKEGPGNNQSVHKAYSRPILNIVFPVEDGIRKWRRDEVRADMQDVEDYSEGVVNKS
jgi:hypothetical protein